ncbi:hypothetical protein AAFF_G00032190 [Aldrovandia affinis]|uniref:Uncharacterized protein n=1 Tax=Aldrovandia affinis TaxID=143900 RepID=A0AAD7S3U5_9TELE|nr:hypothetical protein AAFF_G00032190 [Aldrovandia affinis]
MLCTPKSLSRVTPSSVSPSQLTQSREAELCLAPLVGRPTAFTPLHAPAPPLCLRAVWNGQKWAKGDRQGKRSVPLGPGREGGSDGEVQTCGLCDGQQPDFHRQLREERVITRTAFLVSRGKHRRNDGVIKIID